MIKATVGTVTEDLLNTLLSEKFYDETPNFNSVSPSKLEMVKLENMTSI